MIDFTTLLKYIMVFCLAATLGSLLAWRSKRLFLFIRPEWLRRNIITFLIGLCFFFAIGHLIPDFRNIMENFGWGPGLALCSLIIVLNVLLPYNLVLYITEGRRFSGMDFTRQQVLIFAVIVLSSIVTNGLMNYWMNNSTRYLKYSVVWSFYMAGMGSLIYLFIRHHDFEKKKKLLAKELELARLNEAKSRAELDALHSRINPHFLYNALNSIADLAMTDGKKARKMTISLADLFRYSINYSKSNFATIAEEVETVKLYLEIEKIRFEDQLLYSIEVDKEAMRLPVPKFILQPLLENAVKHGLRATGKMTEILLKIRADRGGLEILVFDNGPGFPAELKPGYGLRSVYEKLELLLPGRFEMQMINQPAKHIKLLVQQPKAHA